MPNVNVLLTDDLMHPNTGESNFNESAYYQLLRVEISVSAASSDW